MTGGNEIRISPIFGILNDKLWFSLSKSETMNHESSCIILNGKAGKVEEIPAFNEKTVAIYEVLRVVKGIPLFYEEHVQRLLHSFKILDKQAFVIEPEIKRGLSELIKTNSRLDGNVKLSFSWDRDKTHENYAFFFIPHKYPGNYEMENGVNAIMLRADRQNPNAKKEDSNLRRLADQIIRRKKVYEVILVDSNGFITEGSRSNVFFLNKDEVFTPLSEKVLPGITRSKIIQVCSDAGIPIRLGGIKMDELSKMEAAFISGTSPGVLPLKKLDEWQFQADHPILRLIKEKYQELVVSYTQQQILGVFKSYLKGTFTNSRHNT